MNEILLDALAEDDYSDDLTLGPSPGVIDGCDVTIERADVLMQFALGQTGDQFWDPREYPMRPGTRHIENVCGVRFRNKQAGAQAVVNATLAGPALPRLAPTTPIPATGIGDVLIEQADLVYGQPVGPFDVGEWPALIIGARFTGPGGARFSAIYDLGAVSVVHALEIWSTAIVGFPGGSGLLVVENLTGEVMLQADHGGLGGVSYFFAAPCAFHRQQLWTTLGDRSYALVHSGIIPVGASSTVTLLAPPYKGVLQSVFTFGGSGDYDVVLQALDYTGAVQETLLDQALIAPNSVQTFEHPGVSSTMQLSVTNQGTGAGAFTWDCVIKEPS